MTPHCCYSEDDGQRLQQIQNTLLLPLVKKTDVILCFFLKCSMGVVVYYFLYIFMYLSFNLRRSLFTVMIQSGSKSLRAPTVSFQMFRAENKQDFYWGALDSLELLWNWQSLDCDAASVCVVVTSGPLNVCMCQYDFASKCIGLCVCVCAKKELIQSKLSARIRSFLQVSRGFYV